MRHISAASGEIFQIYFAGEQLFIKSSAYKQVHETKMSLSWDTCTKTSTNLCGRWRGGSKGKPLAPSSEPSLTIRVKGSCGSLPPCGDVRMPSTYDMQNNGYVTRLPWCEVLLAARRAVAQSIELIRLTSRISRAVEHGSRPYQWNEQIKHNRAYHPTNFKDIANPVCEKQPILSSCRVNKRTNYLSPLNYHSH